MDLLADPIVRSELHRAWDDSLADDPLHRHEEGGYVVQDARGTLAVTRWPVGEQSRIMPAAMDSLDRYNGKTVLAAFHTHPNPRVDEQGREWEQSPGAADLRWHERRRLAGFVIAKEFVYIIDPNGVVTIAGRRDEVL